jgi:hypothetical protein
MAFWSSWTWGQKNHMGDFFIKIPGKKNQDFFVVMNFWDWDSYCI